MGQQWERVGGDMWW